MKLKAPFSWFGGKSRAAELIWDRLGDPANFVEPFAGEIKLTAEERAGLFTEIRRGNPEFGRKE